MRVAAVSVVLAAAAASSVAAFRASYDEVHADDAELGWLVATVRSSLPAEATVVARKWHLASHAEVSMHGFPRVDTLDGLREALLALDQDPLFVYYGSVERWARRALLDLADPNRAPEWLEPVGVSRGPEPWVLYRFEPNPEAVRESDVGRSAQRRRQ